MSLRNTALLVPQTRCTIKALSAVTREVLMPDRIGVRAAMPDRIGVRGVFHSMSFFYFEIPISIISTVYIVR